MQLYDLIIDHMLFILEYWVSPGPRLGNSNCWPVVPVPDWPCPDTQIVNIAAVCYLTFLCSMTTILCLFSYLYLNHPFERLALPIWKNGFFHFIYGLLEEHARINVLDHRTMVHWRGLKDNYAYLWVKDHIISLYMRLKRYYFLYTFFSFVLLFCPTELWDFLAASITWVWCWSCTHLCLLSL